MSENLSMHLNRVYKQSRERIFEAWTTPEQLMRWFAPGTMQARSAEVEPREGGVLRMVWEGISPQTGSPVRVVLSGVFQEVVPGRLLRFSWKVDADLVEDTLVTVKFQDVANGTEVSITQERIASEAILNRNRGGWGACLEKLAALCEAAVEPAA